MKTLTITIDLPEDLEERLLALGPTEWGHTGAKSDDEHVEDFRNTLRLTREHFNIEGATDLHGLYAAGTETVVTHTGTSPNSPLHARIMAGLWNALHSEIAKATA